MEYHGEFVDQPRIELHPAPFATFKGRTYSATVSPESAEIMAKLGTGVLIVPQKPWHLVKEETEVYRATYREAIGEEPPAPIVAGWTFVDDNADRAEEQARTWLQRLLGLGDLALRVRQAAPQVDPGLRVPRPDVRPAERAGRAWRR